MEMDLCCEEMRRMASEGVFENYHGHHSDVPRATRERVGPQGRVMMLQTGAFGAVPVKFCPFCRAEFTQEMLKRSGL
jgi:hypothetical protein